MNKKEKMIYWIKKLKRLPTSKIMALTGTNLEYTFKYLGELEKEGKIERQDETNASYWVLKINE